MCHIVCRHWTVCKHTATHTKKCPSKERKWLAHLAPCKITKDDTYVWDICPPCHRVWRRHSISTPNAIQRVRDYRVFHDYDGPLTPHAWHADDDPIFIRDADGFMPIRLTESMPPIGLGISLPPTPRYFPPPAHPPTPAPSPTQDGFAGAGRRPSTAQRSQLAVHERLLTYLQGIDKAATPAEGKNDDDDDDQATTRTKEKKNDVRSPTITLWPTNPKNGGELVEMPPSAKSGGRGDNEVGPAFMVPDEMPQAHLPSRSGVKFRPLLSKALPPIPLDGKVIDYSQLV